MKSMTFRAVCSMAGIAPGAELVANEGDRAVVATLTDDYGIRLSNGDVLNSPSRAATRVKELVTGKYVAANGWKYWCLGEDGPSLFDVRAKYLVEAANPDLKSLFWDGFYDYGAERQDFVSAYTDSSGRRRTAAGMRRLAWEFEAFARRRFLRSATLGLVLICGLPI